jgi:hypothetical protein
MAFVYHLKVQNFRGIKSLDWHGAGVRPDYGLIALNARLKSPARGARRLFPDTSTF